MKVLFLDIDGVLVTRRSLAASGKLYDQDAVRALNRILKETGAKIVISSTHRCRQSTSGLDDMLQRNGVHPGFVVDKTPDAFDEEHIEEYHDLFVQDDVDCWTRGGEINMWLMKHPGVTNYAAIDDDRDLMALDEKRVFYTSSQDGLTEQIADRIIQLLQAG